ncbi:MAG: hypothetical protein K2K03_04025, partial [Prevotella sp.]|nr:hypothetical protein [Prevotella sp.]
MCPLSRRYARTRSAPCADAVGTMHGHGRHHVRTRSASCADTVGTMCGHGRHKTGVNSMQKQQPARRCRLLLFYRLDSDFLSLAFQQEGQQEGDEEDDRRA